jgi:hypothetical protein
MTAPKAARVSIARERERRRDVGGHVVPGLPMGVVAVSTEDDPAVGDLERRAGRRPPKPGVAERKSPQAADALAPMAQIVRASPSHAGSASQPPSR